MHIYQHYIELFQQCACVCLCATLTTDALQSFGRRLSDLIDQLLPCPLCSKGLIVDRGEIIITKDTSGCPVAHLAFFKFSQSAQCAADTL